ncbi:hypothetical protein Hanom_Chr02g00174161 [Helianthus anomalus]
MEFFRTTDLSFSQTMPMVWRILIVLDSIKKNHLPGLSINDLPIVYCWKLAPPTPESVARIEAIFKLPEIERSFFPNQASSSKHSSSTMSASAKDPIVFDLKELDSYSGPVQVKETPATTSSKSSFPPRPT